MPPCTREGCEALVAELESEHSKQTAAAESGTEGAIIDLLLPVLIAYLKKFIKDRWSIGSTAQ